MKKHKMAGLPVKITSGALKDKYFQVIDYFVNQYQGKSIEKLAKTHNDLLGPVKKRGQPVDESVVFGMILPHREFCCVHDNELRLKPELKIVKENQDDATGTDTSDSEPTKPGESEPVGRTIPSAKGSGKPKGSNKDKG